MITQVDKGHEWRENRLPGLPFQLAVGYCPREKPMFRASL